MDSPTLPFLQNFNGCLSGWPCEWKFEVRSFTRFWCNSDCSFGWGCEHPILRGRGGRRGSGMARFERALVSSYRPSMVTFPLSVRVSEIFHCSKQHWYNIGPTLETILGQYCNQYWCNIRMDYGIPILCQYVTLYIEQDSWAIAKKTARCVQYMGALKIFESSLRTQLLIRKFVMDVCSDQY